MPDLLASDGLPAFPLQPWTRDKLYYVGRYLDIFTVGMRLRWRLVYADLFAGPGLCVDAATGEELPGSALLAARRPQFARLLLNDLDPHATDALRTRSGTKPDDDRLVITAKDCNEAALDARAVLYGANPRGTLGLAVIDPLAFEIGLDAIERMTRNLRMDLIITFMTGYVRRFIGHPSYRNPLDRFFGTERWRDLIPGIQRQERLTYGALLELYKEQLRSIGYTAFNEDPVSVANSRNATVYHIVFASKSERGEDFWNRISRRGPRGQYSMDLDL